MDKLIQLVYIQMICTDIYNGQCVVSLFYVQQTQFKKNSVARQNLDFDTPLDDRKHMVASINSMQLLLES